MTSPSMHGTRALTYRLTILFKLIFIARRYTLSSEYIFQVLKADINYVSSEKIVTKDAKEHRKELLHAIRKALDAVFVYSRKDRTTVLKKEFEDNLKAYAIFQ